MNKFNKIIVATFGGADTVFYIITPILIALLWSSINSAGNNASIIILVVASFSALFRGFRISKLSKIVKHE